MTNLKLLPFTFLLLIVTNHVYGQLKTENIFIITIDGLRWQELFMGADKELISNKDFVKDTTALVHEFWNEDTQIRRQLLMPWTWTTLADHGQILGNRKFHNVGLATNIHWFSYPGYNEMLTGYTDPYINTNDKINNPNITVLEWLNQKVGLLGKVAAFASWDVFPYILNKERANIPVNAGFDLAHHENLSWKEEYLNLLQKQTPSPWSSVRLDVFTHHFALEYIKREHPKVLFVGYGEVDDFGHDARYDHYLHACRRTDGFIKDLWEYCQNDSIYQNKTTFIITTDHGRGDFVKKEWTSHGKIYKGSNEVWAAVMGPDTEPEGERKDRYRFFLNQIAKTAAAFMGYDYFAKEEVGDIIEGVMKQ